MTKTSMEQAALDFSKSVTTRRGDPVEIIKILDENNALANGDRIIAIHSGDLNSWAINGSFLSANGRSSLDLINPVAEAAK